MLEHARARIFIFEHARARSMLDFFILDATLFASAHLKKFDPKGSFHTELSQKMLEEVCEWNLNK